MIKSSITMQSSDSILHDDKYYKVTHSLLQHVYSQINVALISSLFCASLIFIAVYDSSASNIRLYVWAMIVVAVAIVRLVLYLSYKYEQQSMSNLTAWRTIYILGCFLGGASWGLVGVMLLPHASPVQQTLMVLMVAGVSAGSVPLSAAIPSGGIAFLVASILPYILAILTFNNSIYYLFDLSLSLYLIYCIILTFKIYNLIKNSIILKYENDILLNSLAMSNKLLENAATHDPLTNVANRRLFQTKLEEAIQRAQLTESIVALLYIDLDRFKMANDLHGHDAGDQLLKTVIMRLQELFRKEDMIARLGGDELAIILENVKSKEDLEAVARKVCQIIALPIPYKNVTLNVTASIGISLYPQDGETTESLISVSDQCMYQAKESGGNNYQMKSLKIVI